MNLLTPLVTSMLLLACPLWAGAAPAKSLAAGTLEAAADAFRESDWERSVSLYADLATENPAQGLFWYRLATAEYNLKRYEDAIPHYERAVGVGYLVGTSWYNAACCHALLGRTAPAVEALEHAIRNGLRDRERLLREDSDLGALRETPEFRARVLPSLPVDVSRAQGWRIDLDYLTDRLAETHVDPFRHLSRADWDAEIARLSEAIPDLQDHEVVVALMRLVARINDGHTTVFPPAHGALVFRSLPIEFYEFPDGLYVRAADPARADLVGARVVRVGDVSAGEAMERMTTLIPRDNVYGARWLSAQHLGTVEALNALGIVPGLDSVPLTLAGKDGREFQAVVPRGAPVGLHAGRAASWVDMAEPTTELPLWRRNTDRNYWFEPIEGTRIVYVGFNAVLDEPEESLSAFTERLFTHIETNQAETLIVDVRRNHGGNNNLARPLWLAILGSKSINRRGHLFVITGRETFSACQNFCNWLDRDARVLFVGEPTGSRPNFVGEGNEIHLPYSGLVVNASSRLWQDSVTEDHRLWIAPHLAAEMTALDYRTNRDPALEAILDYLATARKE